MKAQANAATCTQCGLDLCDFSPNGRTSARTKVLIADNYYQMAQKMRELVSGPFDLAGTAETGADALRLAMELNPQVVILSLFLPDMDGREVARQLKQKGCKTKIVFASVSLNPDDIDSCLKAGGDAYVVKLRLVTDLVSAVNKALMGERFVSRLSKKEETSDNS
jgi:DNA-binding NarL/FixJ family response regulator